MPVVSDRTFRWSRLFFIAALFIVGISCVGIGGYLIRLNAEFASNDVGRVSAIVDQISETHGRYGLSYEVLFHYSLGQETFYSGARVIKQSGDKLSGGGPVPVKFLINSPQICRIDLSAEDSDRERLTGGYFFIVVVGLTLLSALVNHRRLSRTEKEQWSVHSLE